MRSHTPLPGRRDGSMCIPWSRPMDPDDSVRQVTGRRRGGERVFAHAFEQLRQRPAAERTLLESAESGAIVVFRADDLHHLALEIRDARNSALKHMAMGG